MMNTFVMVLLLAFINIAESGWLYYTY